jgi:hypothetical protein
MSRPAEPSSSPSFSFYKNISLKIRESTFYVENPHPSMLYMGFDSRHFRFEGKLGTRKNFIINH